MAATAAAVVPEEDTELRDLLVQTLENSGVLNRIKVRRAGRARGPGACAGRASQRDAGAAGWQPRRDPGPADGGGDLGGRGSLRVSWGRAARAGQAPAHGRPGGGVARGFPGPLASSSVAVTNGLPAWRGAFPRVHRRRCEDEWARSRTGKPVGPQDPRRCRRGGRGAARAL